MTKDKIIEKLKKAGALLVLFLICAVCTVHADQQFVLAVGETMVIPCLLELWSDQSVGCVITNPEVLIQDGSGRAVIALSEGTSDVYVHMTNPDTDVRYTFVVVPAQRWQPSEVWNQPEVHASADGGGAGDGVRDSDMAGQYAGRTADEGTDTQGGEYRDGIANPRTESRLSEEVRTDLQAETRQSEDFSTDSQAEARQSEDFSTDSQAEARQSEDFSTDSQAEARQSEDFSTDSQAEARQSEDARTNPQAETHADRQSELRLPGNDENVTSEPVPFWEERGSGGISFELIEDDISERENTGEDNNSTPKTKYRPFAYLKSDGEVVPLFVCASGREVRWKYADRILYIEASPTYNGPYRVGAYDSRENIYYFSS